MDINKGDTILSTRDNEVYKVVGFSSEYYIVEKDGELYAVNKNNAVKLETVEV